MFAIRFPVERLEQILDRAIENLDANDVAILKDVAAVLMPEIERDFDVKKTGSTGANSVKWDPKKRPNGKALGVDSGRTESRLLTVEKYHAVEIVFATQYARHFDKLRELIPEAEKLPLDWIGEMDDAAAESAEAAIEDLIESEGFA